VSGRRLVSSNVRTRGPLAAVASAVQAPAAAHGRYSTSSAGGCNLAAILVAFQVNLDGAAIPAARGRTSALCIVSVAGGVGN
jgi:anthranilate phosphoribosyltransferase